MYEDARCVCKREIIILHLPRPRYRSDSPRLLSQLKTNFTAACNYQNWIK